MDDIISKLSNIEDASASVIVQAGEEKKKITEEFRQKQEEWDRELEKETAAELSKLKSEVTASIEHKLAIQKQHSEEEIRLLHQQYKKNKAGYLDELFSRMIGD